MASGFLFVVGVVAALFVLVFVLAHWELILSIVVLALWVVFAGFLTWVLVTALHAHGYTWLAFIGICLFPLWVGLYDRYKDNH